ncbi:hypothetical protein [Sinobaca sp. H24]|uniref:hypothetical protein n=1 Tax=Sinobaca sp. H24 TaxID=2923376 RepID=UPI00207A68B6|nr:hypothetical protein [Sinobaca sp. H24]
MAEKTLANIEDQFEMFQILNEEGKIVNKDALPDLSDEELQEVNEKNGYTQESGISVLFPLTDREDLDSMRR